ncbi:MAG: OadG family protein [Lachnospirales bacterium]
MTINGYFFTSVEVTVMGFIIVIAVLAFICFVLMIFNVVANLENKKSKLKMKRLNKQLIIKQLKKFLNQLFKNSHYKMI